jgi:hypothetical protein
MPKPTHKLLIGSKELSISVDTRSWRVLTPSHFFPEGGLLLQAFGLARCEVGSPNPDWGILQFMPVAAFHTRCKTVWKGLERDRELLSYSYSCQHFSPAGTKSDASSVAFTVRGMRPVLKTLPKGYCTLRLLDDSGLKPGREADVIDLRVAGKVVTDDGGHLVVRRRAMTIDWYTEMPHVLEFCEQNSTGNIEVRHAK